MSKARTLAGLKRAMRALCAWSETSGVPMLVIGGVAVSMLSKPRTTKDVDAVVWLPNHEAWPKFVADGERHGIRPRIEDAVGFAQKARVLLLQHKPSGVPIDVSMGALPFEENAIRRAVPTDVDGLHVPLPVVEDLLVMKALAHRSRDAADIESLLNAHPDVDETWILSTVRGFAEILDTPEMVTDLVKLFGKRVSAKATKKATTKKATAKKATTKKATTNARSRKT